MLSIPRLLYLISTHFLRLWDWWVWSIKHPGMLILCTYQGMTLVAEKVVREARDAAPISAKTSNFLSVTQFNIVMIKSLLKF